MFKKKIVFIFIIIFLTFNFNLVFAKDLTNIQDLKVGEKLEVISNVLVPPGVLGKRYFYINGAQIYSYFKNFPDLEVGDKIKVIGEISEAHNEKRIKINSKEDIKVLSKGEVSPLFFNLNEINEDLIGYFIQTQGNIIEKTGNKMFITSFDKEIREQMVYFKKYVDIDINKFSHGDKILLSGILSKYDNDLELLPRFREDIRLLERKNKDKQGLTPGSSFFKNQEDISPFWSLFNSNKIYFYISSFILALILIFLLIKNKKMF